jgi:tetratricopeptide (TPR) repeat protein
MELLELNAFSTLCGVAAVLCVAFLRLHWPFRFQYMASLHKRRPDRMMRLLEASYRKNRSRTVAMLDKSSCEIMAGNYDLAEKFIVQGLSACKEHPSLFNQALVHYLFYNLATVYFYRGKYGDALEVAFRVYERDRSLTNALGVIVCAHARMGDIQHALEAFELLPKRKARPELQLFCLAEIEAAKGNFERAVHHLRKLLKLHYSFTMHLTHGEIEKRLKEWTKASTQAG